MTCPFYVCNGRPECILGDDRAERHCGPRTYPAGPCTLDAIGRGEAWRAVVNEIAWTDVIGRATSDDPYDLFTYLVARVFGNLDRWCTDHFGAVGWSP